MFNLIKIFKNKKVLITGHTGFKGSWLTLSLKFLGADILGVSKNIPSVPSNYVLSKTSQGIISKELDITNFKKLKKIVNTFKPDFIFHLAAQSLVKKSYELPLETWQTNVLGTINLLESIRGLKKKRVVAIIITSDKAYKNIEQKKGYKETDLLGGEDPYSASKSAAENAIESYQKSFFLNNKYILLGIARAGNVVGGGDWSADRLIPDCVKSWSKSKKVIIRNPKSTRPWQHVLEAVWGYIYFAAKLKINPKLNAEAFNFGPNTKKNFNVSKVIKCMKKYWPNILYKYVKSKKVEAKESKLLKLNCLKAKKKLGWKSILSFEETIKMTIIWYKNYYMDKQFSPEELSINQIKYFKNKFSRIILKK